ncbi:MAG: polyphosphate kinase 2 family protein [Gemmatimonadota bacterium]|jgi:PPK2 family polyphosphate:nucleotide phosphotransferase
MPDSDIARYRIPFDGSFRLADSETEPPHHAPDHHECRKRLDKANERLEALQRVLYADNRYAILLIFQAMDAAGKDGTIRAVLEGVNPAGCQVYAFKQPSAEELDHDFLWRTTCRLPERGRIGIFNRSYYEEVLVVRVHPGYLAAQRLPGLGDPADLWPERLESICDHEKHLARNGTVILKFWLNISKDEQRKRFLSRLDDREKNWKFSTADVKERASWDAYMAAYEEALRKTSRPWAPWYAIPADDKPWMRLVVAETIVETLQGLDLAWPTVDDRTAAEFEVMRRALEESGG